MQLTRKVRIYPSKEQETVLWILSEQCRLVYNFALAERQRAWEQEQKSVSYIDQQNKLPEIKEQYPNYKQVNSKVLQMALRTLDGSYKSFFALIKQDPEARPPTFKDKKYFFTMKYNQSGFRVTDTGVTLSHKVKGGVKLVFPITPYEKIINPKQVEIHFHENQWYLSIIDEIELPKYRDNGTTRRMKRLEIENKHYKKQYDDYKKMYIGAGQKIKELNAEVKRLKQFEPITINPESLSDKTDITRRFATMDLM